MCRYEKVDEAEEEDEIEHHIDTKCTNLDAGSSDSIMQQLKCASATDEEAYDTDLEMDRESQIPSFCDTNFFYDSFFFLLLFAVL